MRRAFGILACLGLTMCGGDGEAVPDLPTPTAEAPTLEEERAEPEAHGATIEVASLTMGPHELEGITTWHVEGRFVGLPARPGSWEADSLVDCEVTDRSDGTSSNRVRESIPLQAAGTQSFVVSQPHRERDYRFCEVSAVVRHTCSVPQMIADDCDLTDSLTIPAVCLTLSPEGTWITSPPDGCIPWWDPRRR